MSETTAEHAQRLLEHGHEHAAGVGLQECPERRTTDNHYFEGVDQCHQVPAR